MNSKKKNNNKRARLDDSVVVPEVAVYVVTYCECDYMYSKDPSEYHETNIRPTIDIGNNVFTSEEAAKDFITKQKLERAQNYLKNLNVVGRNRWSNCFTTDESYNFTWIVIQRDVILTEAIKRGRIQPFVYVLSSCKVHAGLGRDAVPDVCQGWIPSRGEGDSSSSSSDSGEDEEEI